MQANFVPSHSPGPVPALNKALDSRHRYVKIVEEIP